MAQQVQQQEDKKVYALLHIFTGMYLTTNAATVSLYHQKRSNPGFVHNSNKACTQESRCPEADTQVYSGRWTDGRLD